jgi:uncharacterized RDD family membrane protein YckC
MNTVTVATHQPVPHQPAPGATTGGQIVTGEAVPLDIRVARLGSRILALLLDLLVQFVLFVVLGYAMVMVVGLLAGFGLLDGALWSALGIALSMAVLVGYPTGMLALTRGRTVGKLAVGLRVVRDDGGPIGFRHALTRSLVGAAVEFPALLLPLAGWVVSIVSMTANPRSKRIGDHAAGTFVIHERNLESWGWLPAMPPGLAGWAATLDLAGLDDDLALAVRHYLARNRNMQEPARTRLGQQLAQELAGVTSPPPPPGTPGWAYLAAVHAERHARAMRRLAAVRGRAHAVWPELTTATQPYPPPAQPYPLPAQPYPLPAQPYPPPAQPYPPAPLVRPGYPPAARWTAR